MFRVVWAGDSKTVQLSLTHIRQEHMPNLIGAFGNRNADVFFSGFDAVEQAKFNTGVVLGKDGKVDTVPHPRRAQRIGVAEESPYRNHKRAAHLSGIESPLAIPMVKSMKSARRLRIAFSPLVRYHAGGVSKVILAAFIAIC